MEQPSGVDGMNWSFAFFLNSILLGVGLAMDAFSVSLANGLNEPKMRTRKMCGVAGTFAVFQALMPMIGWICVHTIVERFSAFEKFVPWIAFVLLGFIGGKMLYEGIRNKNSDEEKPKVGFWALMLQGVAPAHEAAIAKAFAELLAFLPQLPGGIDIGFSDREMPANALTLEPPPPPAAPPEPKLMRDPDAPPRLR